MKTKYPDLWEAGPYFPQDVVTLFLKLQHSGTENEANLKALSKALRDPAAQLTFIKYVGNICHSNKRHKKESLHLSSDCFETLDLSISLIFYFILLHSGRDALLHYILEANIVYSPTFLLFT